jgi:hypothetical protein
MLPELELQQTFPAAAARLRRALHPGPWLWPTEAQAEALQFAQAVTHLTQSSATTGCALGVTVRDSTATLWALTSDDLDGDAVTAIGGGIHASWRRACAALPRAVPVLGVTLRPHLRIPRIVSLAEWQPSGTVGFAQPESAVDGSSFGLALFLVLASRIAESPVPDGILACATIDELGTLGPVEGLGLKVEAARQRAPRFRMLLVAADQQSEAEALMSGHGEVHAFRTAAEAARSFFEDALVRQLAVDAVGRRELVIETIFRLVLSERLTCWSPVEKAAAMVAASGADYRLEFARAVAARHESNQGHLSFPPDEILNSWPRSLKLNVLAHVVQHAADRGAPDPTDTLARVEGMLPPNIRDGLAAELRLAGAVARLRAFTGHREEAMQAQKELALEHLAALDYDEVSRPLCEWMRLAAALGAKQSFEEAVERTGSLMAAGVLGPDDESYIMLARARGQVILRMENEAERDHLRRLAQDASLPAHVRCSAARSFLASTRRTAAFDLIAEARNLLDITCQADEANGTVFRALADLDEALSQGDGAAEQAALKCLRHANEGLVRNLTLDVPGTAHSKAVALFYPY